MYSKLPNVGTTIFTVMSALAKEHQAINLSQGFPDFPVSTTLIDYVHEAMAQGHNQYAPMIGIPELRNVLTRKLRTLYGCEIDAETELTITPGGTYGIYTALTAILHPGDEVIVLEPAYDSYVPNILTNGAIPICVPLKYPDYSVDWDAVQQAITNKTKAIIINTPHNPTGYVWTPNDMKVLESLTNNTDIYIISDEVYEHITFDDKNHESVLRYPVLMQRSFVVYSFGKVFHTTGWKMGYCVAPKAMMAEFRKIHQFLCFTCNTPMQVGLAKFLEHENEYLQLPSFFQAKRDLFLDLLSDLPFTVYQKTQGSYFQMVGYDRISNLPDKEFAVWLTKEIGVASIPISAFNQNGKDDKLIRFCFAKKDETLQFAAERLQKLK
jgi:methionine aminotransferase